MCVWGWVGWEGRLYLMCTPHAGDFGDRPALSEGPSRQPKICKLPWESENGMIETWGEAVSVLETHRRALRGIVGGGLTIALRLERSCRWPLSCKPNSPEQLLSSPAKNQRGGVHPGEGGGPQPHHRASALKSTHTHRGGSGQSTDLFFSSPNILFSNFFPQTVATIFYLMPGNYLTLWVTWQSCLSSTWSCLGQ